MHVIARTTLDAFVAKHPEAATAIRAWLAIVTRSHFRTTHDVRAVLPATDFLGNSVAIFDLGGNSYRISASIRYVNDISRVGRVYIRHVMTHAEYTRRSKRGGL